ncbi:hypothetical protein AVEN_77021-1 [Araneus ventricosus]|uniref:Uncharacterized protein n=1 Tax=Araneus ventricosus TaxID=182803 RepID=A0A4Y2PT25_ARAVE|nr:hypothetical protein AVEN_77021-1 [Araneus ventricosus]
MPCRRYGNNWGNLGDEARVIVSVAAPDCAYCPRCEWSIHVYSGHRTGALPDHLTANESPAPRNDCRAVAMVTVGTIWVSTLGSQWSDYIEWILLDVSALSVFAVHIIA